MSGGPSGLFWKAGQYVVGIFLLIWILGAAIELLAPLLPWLIIGLLAGIGARVWWWHRSRW